MLGVKERGRRAGVVVGVGEMIKGDVTLLRLAGSDEMVRGEGRMQT